MVLCGILEKVQLILKKVTKMTLKSNEKSNIPFIDERKHRQVHLQELDGEEMRKLLRVGSRVVRGPDWKWDDQVKLIPCANCNLLQFPEQIDCSSKNMKKCFFLCQLVDRML